MFEGNGALGSRQEGFSFSAEDEGEVQLVRKGWATFSVFGKDLFTGKTFQRSHPIEELHERLEEYSDMMEHDLYIVQHRFRTFNRQKLLVSWLCAFYVDLDYYHEDSRSPGEMLEAVLVYCEREKIPKPSAILFSGRGLYLKWYLEDGAPGRALPKWDQIQAHLVKKFEAFGVDRKARDASRVLRIIGSYNQKSGERVEALWILRGEDGKVKRYGFRELGDAILPFTEAEYQEWKRNGKMRKAQSQVERVRGKKGFVRVRGGEEWERIHGGLQLSFPRRGSHIFQDLWKLARLRSWDRDGIPDGERMTFVLWLCNHAALALNGAEQPRVYHEVAWFLKHLVPHWGMQKIHQGLHAVYKRSKAMMKPEGWIEFAGRLYPALYTPKNSSLVAWLKITDQELEQLDYIRTDGTYAAQKRRKEREKGVLSRDEYLLRSRSRREKALDLRESGMTWEEVGGEMGMSRQGAQQLVSRGEK